MKYSSFSLNFASTLALVLISTLILTACAPEQAAPAVNDDATTIETQPNESNPAGTSEMTQLEETSESQTVTITPHYITPGGEETIDIMLTLANGVVTEAQATPQAKHPTSKQMQAGFEQAFSGAVIGKTLAELETIDRIGGASLTTGGFRKAVTELNQS